jgi:hypothetical protein
MTPQEARDALAALGAEREAGDREAGDREAGDREAGDREAASLGALGRDGGIL